MSDFFCKKCGNQTYDLKEVAMNNGGSHLGQYCANCGMWHKWLNKDEFQQLLMGAQQVNIRSSANTTPISSIAPQDIDWHIESLKRSIEFLSRVKEFLQKQNIEIEDDGKPPWDD